jgi:glycosyltransferase involved in cell wall biosynthesis
VRDGRPARNADAACHFANDVLPLIARRLGQARFHIVGAAPPPEVTALASDAVVVHGQVPDVRPHLLRADVVVVPIRGGGGTRLKVLEAAACGKAIVSTALGIEGLPFRDGHDVVVADSADAFAAAVINLVNDPGRADALGRAARSVASSYDWSAVGATFRHVLAEVATSATDARP